MKRFACIAAILLLLVICGIASAEEDDKLPAEIKQYFDNEISIVEIEDFSYSKQFLFAIAKNSNKRKRPVRFSTKRRTMGLYRQNEERFSGYKPTSLCLN